MKIINKLNPIALVFLFWLTVITILTTTLIVNL